MRRLGILIVLVLAACGGCAEKVPDLPVWHQFEQVGNEELLVTHFYGEKYTFKSGCYLEQEGGRWVSAENAAVAQVRRSTPVLVGNNGFLCGRGDGLAKLANRLWFETGAAVAIEPTPFVEKTTSRARIALAEGVPVFLLGYSAGCRDEVSVLGLVPGRVKPFLVEPTYQCTHGYARVPDKIDGELVCFRIRGGSALTFSGRDYRPEDFENPGTKFENVPLDTSSHTSACEDPKVFERLKTEILLLRSRPVLPPLELASGH